MRDPHQMIAGPNRIHMRITHPGLKVSALSAATVFYRIPGHRALASPAAGMGSRPLS